MKKLTILFCGIAAILFSSCSHDEKFTMQEIEDYYYKHVPTKRVTDYLYEVNNDDYYANYIYNPFASSSSFNGASRWHGVCAGVRNGNFFGRNLDWSCSHQPEFLIRTPAKDGKHATIAVCCSGMVSRRPTQDWLSQLVVNDLTMNAYDGINDAGVCMVVLVVHYSDDSETTGTNPNAELQIHGSNVVRYVLDNASSAAEGIELLKQVNVFGTLEDYTFHWLLCDEKESYFVEIVNNNIVACKCEENSVNPEFTKPVITNFYMLKDYASQIVPGGVERYELLNADYEKTNNVAGMFRALENIRFSRKYEAKDPSTLAPGEKDMNWYSEFYESTPNYENIFEPLHFNRNSDHQYMYDHCIRYDIELNSIYMLREKGLNPRDYNLSSWTCHTSVYNIKERSLQLVIGENYTNILPSAITSFQLK